MQSRKIAQVLGTNAYPGRGIILGKSADGRYAAAAYFIMGRSENSRNRVFAQCGDGIKTRPFDSSKAGDPSLIIYTPVKVLGDKTIVTNGDQTDTIYEYLARGDSFEDALRTRTFEPDGPNFTPRISGLLETGGSFSYKLSIVKSAGGDPSGTERFFYEYASPADGKGHLIQTYNGDGDPLPSFDGEPVTVDIDGGIDEFAKTLWEFLNEDNKISLFVRFINLQNGLTETRIFNKNN
ncbi:MAG TPA: inosine monophosphate cyclohydrolase [Ruminococcaceae bacterium]|nr:inosine monophosphate cyclohydrolase [Oscillospiraceae bacterium]